MKVYNGPQGFLGPGRVFGCPDFQLLFLVSASRGGLPLVGAPILMMMIILMMKGIILIMVMMMVVIVVVCSTTDPPGPSYLIPLQQTEVMHFNLTLTLFSAAIAKSNFEIMAMAASLF